MTKVAEPLDPSLLANSSLPHWRVRDTTTAFFISAASELGEAGSEMGRTRGGIARLVEVSAAGTGTVGVAASAGALILLLKLSLRPSRLASVPIMV